MYLATSSHWELNWIKIGWMMMKHNNSQYIFFTKKNENNPAKHAIKTSLILEPKDILNPKKINLTIFVEHEILK